MQKPDEKHCRVHEGRMNYTYCEVQRLDEIYWRMQRQDETNCGV
jgi:hypothetical protein